MTEAPRKVKKNRCGIIIPYKIVQIKTPGWAFFISVIQHEPADRQVRCFQGTFGRRGFQ